MTTKERVIQVIEGLPADATLDQIVEPLHHFEHTEPFSLISAADRVRLPEDVEDAYPLARLQAGMLLHMELTPEQPLYHDVATLTLRKPFRREALEEALRRIAARHAIFRTGFHLQGFDEPLQVVHREAVFRLTVEDLRHHSALEQADTVRTRMRVEIREALDLTCPPLLRFHVQVLDEERFQLTLAECHAILDGWSLTATLGEIFGLYGALLRGENPPTESPPEVTYRDFVAMERRTMESPVCREWWRHRLEGVPPERLPRLSGGRAGEARRVVKRLVELPEEVVAGLRRLEAAAAVPRRTVYLTAHLQVMALLSGTREVLTGVTTNGRPETADGERVRGLFLNTLPFHHRLPEGSWAEVARSVFTAEREMLPFRRYPIAALQEERLGEPLCESFFNYVHFHGLDDVLRAEGISGLALKEHAETNFVLLGSFGIALGERVFLNVDGDAAVLGDELLEALPGCYLAILRAMAKDPMAPAGQVELLNAAERRRVVQEWNCTAAEFPADRCIHQLFEAQAARMPGASAVICGDRAITYRELDRRANRLAHDLAGRGVGPETRVGVCLQRSPELVLALLAILKAGAAYVPMDPEYPAERLGFMLRDAAIPVLLTHERLRHRLPEHGAEVVLLDRIAGEDDRPPRAEVTPEHLAYVIYTSGSTGTPKGTEVPHRAIPGFFRGADYVCFDERQVVLQHSSVSWDALTLELWPALLTGGRCVLFEGRGGDVPALAEAVRRHGVTTLWLTSALFDAVVDTAPEMLAGVSQVMTGGETVSAVHARRALELQPELRLVNGYGPSECTVFATCQVVELGFEGASLPVGRPVGDRRVYVLDAWLEPVPAGVPGELFVGGPAVARGYLGCPELTAERFVPDPLATEPGMRLYRSGDRVRWRPDGTVEFVGRLDGQVKIRGFRIERAEVESALSAYPGVREARVVVREDTPGEKRLVGYVVGGVDGDTLRSHLRDRMPEYMVPSEFVPLESLPLTPNGKLDVRALPAPEPGSGKERYIAPTTPVEEGLVGIWAEVLRLERVGVKESFFELGGHSLLATRAVSRVREVFGIELPLRALFDGPTVAELAGRVEALRRAGVPVLPPLVPTERTGALPLSFAQERLWFLDRLEPGSTTYNIPVALRLTGELDVPALERSLGEIVRRHEALRTVFHVIDGCPVQVVAPFGSFMVQVGDLSGLAEAEREPEMRRLAVREAVRPFDLSMGPLIRARLLRLGGEEHVLLLCMHHIVTDGWSMGVLFREMSALYAACRDGGESPLAELPVQYADYAAWQREHLQGEALERQLSYWRERLAGAPALLELPTDHPRPAVRSYCGASETMELAAASQERLRVVGQREGATLFMVVLSAFQVLLGKYAGSEDVVVGSAIAGRNRREIEELIGFFVNSLVLRTDLSGDPSFREVLGRVRETTLGAYEHQEFPFEKLVAELQPQRSLSHSPLFQVMFTLQNGNDAVGGLPGLRMERMGVELDSSNFDLTLTLVEHASSIHAVLKYNTDLFECGTIQRMLGHLERVLEQATVGADVRLSQLALLSQAEHRQVLEEWNRTAAEYPSDHCVHQLFEAQVERTPDAVAVVFEERAFTYHELNERANRLAHHLIGHGAGPEVRVGLCLERGLEMVLSILAVLKAGGAYVPMDPSHPTERLRVVLTDAAIAVLLTQEGLRERLPTLRGVQVVSIDLQWEEIAAGSAQNPVSGVGPGNLAYVIYTSGSTGVPMGVGVEHRSLVNYLTWFDRAVLGVEGFLVPMVSRLTFDAHVRQFYPPLLRGEAVWVLPEETAADPKALLAALSARERVSFGGVPSLWSAVLDAIDYGGLAAPMHLRAVLLGGEALPAELVRRSRERFPDARIWNHYGPTEATVNTAVALLDNTDRVSLGVPIGNVRVYLLDGQGNPVPAGVPGELYVGGVGVARGYLARPERTAERFLPDRFSGEAGARLYRSGDRVRWRGDGELEYLGRVDHQVKIRGFRIELGEVEAALRQQVGVRECVVVAREDMAGEKRLVGYVAGEVEVEALRVGLRRRLPEYMVPGAFVVLGSLPLTPNGKLDRRALPAPEHVSGEERFVAPRTPVEEALAQVWAEVLKVERVGVHDNFFQLGGHSLLAVTLVERMRRRGLHADVRALFTTPTVAEIATAVGSGTCEVVVPPNRIPAGCDAITPEMLPLVGLTQAEIDRVVATVPGGAANVQDVYPLAPLQEGILFHHLMVQTGDPYLLALPFAFESREGLDAYLAALQAVCERHDILRTAIVWEGLAEPVQVVWRRAPLRVEEVEVEVGDVVRQLYERFDPRHHRIDLRRAPLLRGYTTYDAAREHWVLLLLKHHLVSDHTSLEVLREELEAHLLGRADQLPAVQPFRNYVAQARLGVSRAEHEAFFRELLGDVDEPTAPFGLVDIHGDGLGLEQARVMVEEGLGARLRERARALGVSAASVCHVAWAQVLSRTSGRRDVVFGTVLFGRMQGGDGADRVLGPFINTLPVRIRVGEEGAVASVRHTQAQLASLVRHEHASLALAQQCSGVQAPAPLFSTLFNYRHSPRGGKQLSVRRADPGIRPVERSNYPLNLSVDDLGDRFYLTAQVEAGVGAERVCTLMHTALEGLVHALEAAPERSLGRIEVVPEVERRQVVEEWNRTGGGCSDPPVHELFAEQARRAPDAIALLDVRGAVTYGALDRRAEALARHLRELGVGPETPVGLCMERSPELLVGVLGIWKAGGAYVPLDPTYPAERLGWILADAAASVVVTTGSAAAALPQHTATLVRADQLPGETSDAAPERPVCAASLAYVIYTSGSTGHPKGVLVQHGSLSNLLAATRKAFGIAERDVMPALASYAFDIWLFEALLPLTSGGAVRLVLRERVLDVPALLEEIADATLLHAVPALMRQVLHAERETPRLGRLRRAFIGGDRVPADLLAQMRETLPGAEAHVLYGPTEGTILASAHPVPEDGVVERHPIGRPLGNVRLYICDADENPQPVGVPGELLIGGAGVARGYLGHPEQTAERFVPDPFSGVPGVRLYRTGDRARWAADGTLEFLGRVDRQVKVRGFRIEPGEIETRLTALDEVREAVVVARDDGAGGTRLVAYVVGAVEGERQREQLRRSLPEYMVPDAFVVLDRLPLTPNGKVDLRALPEPDACAREYVEPRTALQRVIAETWGEVLGVERVGLLDNFFELGGHSLVATRVVSRLKVLRMDVPLRALFEAPTVEELARAILDAEERPGQGERVAEVLLSVRAMSPEDRRKALRTLAGRFTAGND